MTRALFRGIDQLGVRDSLFPVCFRRAGPNVTLSRIPRDVEANSHYDLIKQIDVFRNHQTVTSFPRRKFVRKNLYEY